MSEKVLNTLHVSRIIRRPEACRSMSKTMQVDAKPECLFGLSVYCHVDCGCSHRTFLSHAESLCRIIDKVPDRRDRMAAYSALSHTIYGTFVIAQSGIYPLKEKERSFVLQAATLRARRRTKTVDRYKFIHSTIGEAEKHGKLATKRLLEKVNNQLEAIGCVVSGGSASSLSLGAVLEDGVWRSARQRFNMSARWPFANRP
jgi:hypothetical protein